MTLYEKMFTSTVKLNQTIVSDGEGGTTVTYTESEEFNAAITLDNSVQAAIAQKDGVKGIYNITTSVDMPLKHGDIIKRVDNGKTYRVTGKENMTPSVATFHFYTVKGEEWEVPDDE